MRSIHHRLISRILALIALLSFSVPAYAREVGEDAQRAEETLLAAPEWALAADEYSAARALTEENARLAAGASAEDVSTSIEEIADGDGQEGVLRARPCLRRAAPPILSLWTERISSLTKCVPARACPMKAAT